jgi:hypothetical protein
MAIALRDVPPVLFAVVALASCYRGSDGGGAGTDSTAGDTADDDASASSPTADDDDDGPDDGVDDDASDPSTDPDSGDADASASDPSTDTQPSTDGGSTGGGSDADAVCMRWNADRADLDEGTWSGSVASCDPGDISASGRENALRVTNLYRWIADLPPITTDPARDALAQACALIMHANGQLSHRPPSNWTCWTSDGAEGAGNSNIASTAGVFAVDLYMVDPGNPTTLGHRRWILSNSIGPTGLGSTSEASCMWTLGGSNDVGAEWTAWPPPGAFPWEASQLPWTSMDETGWSIQSDSIDLGGAQVEITADGAPMPVSVTPLLGGYGSDSAISMIPQGWSITAGTTYHVRVDGVGQTIEYDVEVVACT